MMIYTGIGPRNAPPKVLEVCEQIGGRTLAKKIVSKYYELED